MINQVHNSDCLLAMRKMKDNQFDLAIVDPPYMDNINEYMGMQKRLDRVLLKKDKAYPNTIYQNVEHFKKPNLKYFNELRRISKNQIIWGINHYEYYFGSGRIIWDKDNSGQFNDCELAYQSKSNSVRIFRWMWNGMLQQNMKNKEIRIHPTQKPIALYKWLLKNYAKQNDTILDTHVGSGSSRIACWEMGFDFTGYEIDLDYWKAQEKRFKIVKDQQKLF